MYTIDEVAEKLDKYAEIYSILFSTSESIRIKLLLSPLYNFRDALAHYRKLYKASDPDEKLSQTTSIIEHLNRGLKDGCYFILLKVKIGVDYELKNVHHNSSEKTRKLRTILHRYKSLELALRGPEMIDLNTIINCINNLVPLIQETKALFQQHGLEWDFSKNK